MLIRSSLFRKDTKNTTKSYSFYSAEEMTMKCYTDVTSNDVHTATNDIHTDG